MSRLIKNRLYIEIPLILILTLFLALLFVPPVHSGQLEQQDLTDVYNRVSPSVVAINVRAEQTPDSSFPVPIPEVAGSGSGFVIDTEGHILTNSHVVENATDIEVNFLDGTIARAEVIGLDPDSDLAVLKVELPADQLRPVEFADSEELYVGQPVLAIGSPFGQRWTLTSGIISALDRSIRSLTDFSVSGVIQTDAAINPGNSGGPLLDMQGRVIGVNSQIATSSGANDGVGFAIPSNLAQRVARELIEKGYIEYSFLGITGGDMTLDVIEAFDLPNNQRGVVVNEVSPGGPAARAGLESAVFENDELQSADIITAINGEPLRGIGDLISYLANYTAPGDRVTLTVLRNGSEELTLEATLVPRP